MDTAFTTGRAVAQFIRLAVLAAAAFTVVAVDSTAVVSAAVGFMAAVAALTAAADIASGPCGWAGVRLMYEKRRPKRKECLLQFRFEI
jgi:uncharacterized cupredoxin-like copper-binding protein